MKLFSVLKQVVQLLEPHNGSWAICGGVAASVYRDTPRYTGDIDIVLLDRPLLTAQQIAEQIASALGYEPIAGFLTDQKGELIKAQALVVGREQNDTGFLGLDFLLPVLPWVSDAVTRAQSNKFDFGFSLLPTITIEDLCIAKLFAVQGTPDRVIDMDDLIAMTRSAKSFDRAFFENRVTRYGLRVPELIRSSLDKISQLKIE